MSARELIWDAKRRKWIPREEHESRRRIKEALRELLEEVEFEVDLDLKSGKGRMKIKHKTHKTS